MSAIILIKMTDWQSENSVSTT